MNSRHRIDLLSLLRNFTVENPFREGNGQTGDIAIDEAAYIKSTEWEIVSKTGTIHEVSYDCCPQVYQGPFVKL